MEEQGKRVALGRQLSHCPNVVTLGVKPNPGDYEPWQWNLIRGARKIYFPTLLYVEALHAMGKETFPSVHTYRHLGDKIKQAHIFQLLALPVPRTRLYYGPRQQERISAEFSFPFIAKTARGSSRGDGVWLIRDRRELESYLKNRHVALIQEYVPLDRDLRVVIIGQRVVHAYWKELAPGEFRTNLAKGGRIRLDRVPREALAFGLETAIECGFDHVGLDLCEAGNRFLLLEANMAFGRTGFRAVDRSYREILRAMVESDEI